MSTKGISANRLELLQIADAVAREKSIDKAIVISAMEEAIQKAAASRYGIENNIKAEINTETGSITLVFSDKPLVLKKWIVIDAQNIKTTVNLNGIETGVKLDPKLFTFSPEQTN